MAMLFAFGSHFLPKSLVVPQHGLFCLFELALFLSIMNAQPRAWIFLLQLNARIEKYCSDIGFFFSQSRKTPETWRSNKKPSKELLKSTISQSSFFDQLRPTNLHWLRKKILCNLQKLKKPDKNQIAKQRNKCDLVWFLFAHPSLFLFSRFLSSPVHHPPLKKTEFWTDVTLCAEAHLVWISVTFFCF